MSVAGLGGVSTQDWLVVGMSTLEGAENAFWICGADGLFLIHLGSGIASSVSASGPMLWPHLGALNFADPALTFVTTSGEFTSHSFLVTSLHFSGTWSHLIFLCAQNPHA